MREQALFKTYSFYSTTTIKSSSYSKQYGPDQVVQHLPCSNYSVASRYVMSGQSKFLNIIFENFCLNLWDQFLELFGKILKNLMSKQASQLQLWENGYFRF